MIDISDTWVKYLWITEAYVQLVILRHCPKEQKITVTRRHHVPIYPTHHTREEHIQYGPIFRRMRRSFVLSVWRECRRGARG